MSTPLAVRNNNPLCIENGGPYEGSTGKVVGKYVFQTPAFGFRAAFINYIHKFDRGVNTIRKLIYEWSPPSDPANPPNSTLNYVSAVAKTAGFSPDEEIKLKEWEVASRICYAQSEFESGEPFELNWTMTQMAEGAFRAGIVDAPTPIVKRVIQKVAGSGAAISSGAAAVEPIVSGWAGQIHSPNLQTMFFILAGLLALIAAFSKK